MQTYPNEKKVTITSSTDISYTNANTIGTDYDLLEVLNYDSLIMTSIYFKVKVLKFDPTLTIMKLSIDSHDYAKETLEEVILCPSIVEISSNCFYHWTKLSKINLENVKKIGTDAFSFTNISSITIPTDVDADSPFNGCKHLNSITLTGESSSIDVRVFYGLFSPPNVSISNCNSLEVKNYGIINKQTLKLLLYISNSEINNSIPNEIDIISPDAFICSKKYIKTIKFLSNSLINLPDRLFENNIALETVEFSSKVMSIGKRCFANCENLRELNLQYVFAISDLCFYRVSNFFPASTFPH